MASDEVSLPATIEEAVDGAVKRILRAASDLCLAADLAQDGEIVSHYINSAIRLRDLANSLSPGGTDWPKEGAAIIDLKTRERLN